MSYEISQTGALSVSTLLNAELLSRQVQGVQGGTGGYRGVQGVQGVQGGTGGYRRVSYEISQTGALSVSTLLNAELLSRQVQGGTGGYREVQGVQVIQGHGET